MDCFVINRKKLIVFKSIISACLFQLFVFFSFAHSQLQDLQFTHLSTEEGLSQSNVTCILQDSKGFMWFGTFNGLNRYDGYNFESFHYHQNDSNSLSHNYISALIEDRKGYIWVGTSGGLNRYDPKTNRFKSYLEFLSQNQNLFIKPQKQTNYALFTNLKL